MIQWFQCQLSATAAPGRGRLLGRSEGILHSAAIHFLLCVAGCKISSWRFFIGATVPPSLPSPPTPPRRYPLSGSHRPGRPRPQGGAITAARALRRRGASPALSRRSAGPRAVRGRLAVPPGVPHRAGLLPETNPGRCQNRGPAQRAAVRCEAVSEALRTERVSLRRRESFFLLVFLPTKQRDTHEFLRPEEPAACVRFCAAVRVAVNKANVS